MIVDAKTVKGLIKGAFGAMRLPFKGVVSASGVGADNQLLVGTGLSDEALTDLEYFQHYGHASRPLAGLQKIVLPVGGKTAHAVVIAVQGDKLMVGQLLPGESIQYAGGGFIHSKVDGTHHVKGKVVFDDDVLFKGQVKGEKDITAGGDVSDQGGTETMAGMRSKYNQHGHDGGVQPDPQM